MIATSDAYKQLFADGAIQEYRVEIDGTMYTNESIYSIALSQDLFDKDIFTLGSFCTSQIKIKFKVKTGDIPRNAILKFYYRYVQGPVSSEWILKFTGRVTGRSGTTTTTVEAKDVASNTEIFLDVFQDMIPSYPANARQVTSLAAAHLGLTVDNISAVWNGSVVEYPNELSIIQVLKNIAVLSGGNWTITGDGKLRLVQPNPRYTIAGVYASQSSESLSETQHISRVTVYWDDEQAFTAGNDSAMQMELDCPWATQGTTNATYSLLAQFYYKGHRAIRTYADPAIELGDYFLLEISSGGAERQLGDPEHFVGQGYHLGGTGANSDPAKAQFCARMDWTFDGSCSVTVEAPCNNEYIYDDPYNTLANRQFKRKLTLGDSYHGVTIGRDNGIQMVWSPDGTVDHATGRFYADLTTGIGLQYRNTYTDQWKDWLYFDKNQKVFKLALYNDSSEIASMFEISETSIKTFVGDNYETIAGSRAAVSNAIQSAYNYTNQTREGIYNQIAATYVTLDENQRSEAIIYDSIATLQATAQGLEYTVESNYNALLRADEENYDALRTYADTQISITAAQITSEMSANYATKKERSDGDKLALESANSAINQKANEIYFNVSAQYATQSYVSTVKQQADKISWLVSGGTSQSNMTMTPESINFVANNINLNGVRIMDGSIRASKISSDFFYGKKYHNSSGSTYITMDTANNEDSLILYNQGNIVLSLGKAMSETQGVNFWSYGRNWLGYSATRNTVFPKGAWDFTNATVRGIDVIAKWG